MLEHGGQLRLAAHTWGIPLGNWLDLSTGINPQGWPVPDIPTDCWQRLPESNDGLEAAAAYYYAHPAPLPVAGSQAALQILPRLRPVCRVGVQTPAYAEHAHAWQSAGHHVQNWAPSNLDNLDVLILINPNNPTGATFTTAQLLDWHGQLARRGGWLILDEAFMDATPAASLSHLALRPGLIILRSLGKFFGLAGARVGFVLTEPQLAKRIQDALGPWTLSGPARWVAQRALTDHSWQQHTRHSLLAASARLHQLLTDHHLPPAAGTALFQWLPTPQAQALHTHLAQRGILTRHFPGALRLGLPGTEADWQRLTLALAEFQP